MFDNPDQVHAKKRLGQHFLNNEEIAARIAGAVLTHTAPVLEIGPGMGILTRHLLQQPLAELSVIEIDEESVAYLKNHFPQLGDNLIAGDFLKYDLSARYAGPFVVAGNFPYNISSQILFKVLECKDQVVEVVGMFQKEVAERITAASGTKQYGILSVLLNAYYDTEYLFTVSENEFTPPPKVKSAVVRLSRNFDKRLDCDEKAFRLLVKTAFNYRRKTLRNALRALPFPAETAADPIFTRRAEQLSVQDYVRLCNMLNTSTS